MQRRVKFRETEYLLIGGDLTKGGAITTEDEYVSGAIGYAHLYEDGIIRRYGQEIGKREDIQDLGPADVEMSEEGEERLYDDMARICLEFMGGTVTRYEDGIIWRSDEGAMTRLGHEHCEAVIASLERQVAWYREEGLLLEAENARLKQDLRDLESNVYHLGAPYTPD